tara:strand:- start:125 stop:370 length:246 start_codon:yes stop_codon:yes gene_type:complete
MSEDLTAAQIAANYEGMFHSVQGIQDVIDGNPLSSLDTADKAGCISRHVTHLERLKTRDYWTTEDMSPIDAAITAGKAWSE